MLAPRGRLVVATPALYLAAVYATFLVNIEPSEQPFHAADVPVCLAKAAADAEHIPAAR